MCCVNGSGWLPQPARPMGRFASARSGRRRTMDHMGSAASSHRARRFGARAICAAVGLALIAVPFGVLLLLVRDGWAPLRQLDLNTSTSLHRYVADHGIIVVFARVFSALGFDCRMGRRLRRRCRIPPVAAAAAAGAVRGRYRRDQLGGEQPRQGCGRACAAGTARSGSACRRLQLSQRPCPGGGGWLLGTPAGVPAGPP